MAANKVVFGNKVLIDLTGDTVTEEALLKGYTAHKADGTIITGTAFAGYPNEFVFLDNIEDSSGNPIKDSSGKTVPVKQFRDKPSIAKPVTRFFWILRAM